MKGFSSLLFGMNIPSPSPFSYECLNMNSREKILDISVAVFLLLCIFWSFGTFLYIYLTPENKENFIIIMQSLNPILIGLALITCLVLALWVILVRGVESRLWNWLPPFVFFRQFNSTARKALVALLILAHYLA